MFKCYLCIFLSLGLAAASHADSEAGAKVGDILRSSIGNSAFRNAYAASASKAPALVNSAVASVIAAANAKANNMASFLARQSEPLNLFVSDGVGDASSRILGEEELQQRKQLTRLQSDEADFKEALANELARKSAHSASFLEKSRMGSAAQIDASIKNYEAAIDAGGYTAYHALSSLLAVAGEPNGRMSMHLYTPLLAKLKTLMGRESTSDQTRILAGSIITLLTNMPVSSSISDEKSGSYGHVNIVLPRPSRVYTPDIDILALQEGARASDTIAGGYYGI
jgi:hypothetical protein